MFNGNYIKIDHILGEVNNFPYMEAMTKRQAAHKLVDLLGLIRAVMPLQRTYATLKIEQHKATLPKGIMYIHGVKNHGLSCDNPGIPMRYATDIYHSRLHSEEAKANCKGESLCPSTFNSLYGPKAQGDYKTTGGELEMSLRSWQVEDNIPRQYAENSYTINGTSIDTSMPCGFITVAYDAIKLDSDGFPMIPDDKSFKEAFKFFLLKSFIQPEYIRGNVPQHIYQNIDTEYSWYVGQAENSFKMLNPDQMEAMISGLVRIIPRSNNTSDGWKSFNKKENLGGPLNSPRTTEP